ncbi:MAG: ATP-dependent metallopeptidase FtsH/Yme1/Tma family protein [Chloroflexi bacterium]|nr:MAG: ATP-dependent metallopeptidase FtsH/Yme1/Tma family protein [Chloroflexota bacterium]
MIRVPRSSLFYFALVLVLGVVFWITWQGIESQQKSNDWTYSQLVNRAGDHQVKSLVIKGSDGEVTELNGNKHAVHLPDNTEQLASDLAKNDGVDVTYESANSSTYWLQVLVPNLILLLLIGGFMYYILRQTQSGNNQAMSFGRSRARLIAGDKPAITFSDVAGVEEAKQELTEIVEFLKYPEKFVALGARIPKGVLLVGPPGTGKTLLSKAVAGEAGVPFFSISGSEFVEMFVGVGASRVRDLFDQAKKNSPCIVFVDEIDAVGRQRGAGLGGGHDEREQTLNQLLVEMDGFDTNTHVIVIAATNRPDVLDPALLRPGRFDRHVTLDRPDIKGRRAILDVHARNKPLDTTVDLDVLARQTPGFSGADLSNLINEAAILAARANKKVIGMDELEESIARVIAGPEKKSRRISEHEKSIIAYHEVGHALVMKSLPNCDPVHKISIVSRGMALGWTMSLPEEDRYLISRSQLVDQLAGTMGGRAAEAIIFGDITSGASDDIQRVTDTARRMVTQWGMSEKLGTVAMGVKQEMVFLGRDLGEQRNYSEEIAALIDEEVRGLVSDGYETAKRILTERRGHLELISEHLKNVETIDAAEFDRLLAQEPPAAAAASRSTAS